MFKKIMQLAATSKTQAVLLASTAAISCCMINTAQAIPFHTITNLYFFGDSLTDSGYNDLYPDPPMGATYAPLPAGKAPTFTTLQGYIWSQYVAQHILGIPLTPYSYPSDNNQDMLTNNTTNINLLYQLLPPAIKPIPDNLLPVSHTLTHTNYACGGATTKGSLGNGSIYPFTGNGSIPWAPTINEQVDHFLETNPTLDPNAVYFIWGGANDILETLELNETQPAEVLEYLLINTANTAAINIAEDVAKLRRHGARNVVVMSLPNIGLAPEFSLSGNAQLIGLMKVISATFNGMLNQQLGRVIATTGVHVLYVDIFTLLDDVVASAAEGRPYRVGDKTFHFTNYQDPACGVQAGPDPFISALFCTTPSALVTNFVFADGVHPTDEAHQLLALTVEELLRAWNPV